MLELDCYVWKWVNFHVLTNVLTKLEQDKVFSFDGNEFVSTLLRLLFSYYSFTVERCSPRKYFSNSAAKKMH